MKYLTRLDFLLAPVVAFNDLAFPGFPTFPVVHRWHIQSFGTLLPKQFVNQGGDPFLYELYSRFGASGWEVSCTLENTIGGESVFSFEISYPMSSTQFLPLFNDKPALR